MQTGKLESFPVVALGGDFWSNLGAFVQETMLAEGTISQKDLHLIKLATNVEEAINFLKA